jgi:hypothetical protein
MTRHLPFALLALVAGCSTLPPKRADLPPLPPGMKYQARTVEAAAVVAPPVTVSHPVLAWQVNGQARETGLQQSNSPLGPWSVVTNFDVAIWPHFYTAKTTVTNQAFWRAYTR